MYRLYVMKLNERREWVKAEQIAFHHEANTLHDLRFMMRNLTPRDTRHAIFHDLNPLVEINQK